MSLNFETPKGGTPSAITHLPGGHYPMEKWVVANFRMLRVIFLRFTERIKDTDFSIFLFVAVRSYIWAGWGCG